MGVFLMGVRWMGDWNQISNLVLADMLVLGQASQSQLVAWVGYPSGLKSFQDVENLTLFSRIFLFILFLFYFDFIWFIFYSFYGM